jgi:DNA polymerase-3 subunit delta'
MAEPFPWQHEQWCSIVERAQHDRLPHALLLAGKDGLGKRLFAERIAHALLCKASDINSAPCGICRNCQLFQAGNHPDYLSLEPEDSKKPIRVDQIRSMGEFIVRTSQSGRYKIILLHPADRMNLNAANSLLKTLEEPPGVSLLLLVTSAPSKLPATIRSRCQQLAFFPPDPATGQIWLKSQTTADVDPLLLLNLAGGAPLLALQYAESGWLNSRRQLCEGYNNMLLGKLAPAELTESWMEDEDLETRLGWLVSWHMDMIRLKLSSTPEWLINFDLQTLFNTLVQRFTRQQLFDFYQAALKLYNLRHTQANIQLHLENFFYISSRRA